MAREERTKSTPPDRKPRPGKFVWFEHVSPTGAVLAVMKAEPPEAGH